MAFQAKVYERVLNMAQMHQIGVLHRGPNMLWTCRWNEEGRVSSIHYELQQNPQDRSLAFRLRYQALRDGREPESTLDYMVTVRTSQSFKGKTWYWFVCPLIVNGRSCRRRVRNLYFLPSSPYFGCQHCRDEMLRSLPVAKRTCFRQTRVSLLPNEAQGAGESDIKRCAGWRPADDRRVCPHCRCLSEGMYCCSCGKPMRWPGGGNYLEILGVTPEASVQDIRVAFMTRCKEYHPDRVAHLGKRLRLAAEEEFKQINLAYEVLKDPDRRLDYLRWLGKE
jgi:hypothetical protein